MQLKGHEDTNGGKNSMKRSGQIRLVYVHTLAREATARRKKSRKCFTTPRAVGLTEVCDLDDPPVALNSSVKEDFAGNTDNTRAKVRLCPVISYSQPG